MSSSGNQSADSIDRGAHKRPEAIIKKSKLLEKALSNYQEEPRKEKEEDVFKSFEMEEVVEKKEVKTVKNEYSLPLLDRATTEFINSYPREAEEVIRWYSSIKNARKTKNKILLGIEGFPFKVKVNPLHIRKEDSYLSVFVKSDNSLEISLPVASEVTLEGELDGEAFDKTSGMFLGEITFSQNFLFKILIFVVK
jgi:hypothetical protein